jgi:hypothetical protein
VTQARWVSVVLTATALVAAPALARDSLGIYGDWGAFRDAEPFRCYAIAEPAEGSVGKWKPFVTLAWWPTDQVRGQFHVRLSRERRAAADVFLEAGGRKWRLAAGKYDAWSPSAAHDAFIVARLRSSRSFSVSSVSRNGGGFADTYRLNGAASAFDAAALGCAKGR